MGADKATGEIVALKRINTEEEENGFPITAIREVKILKALKHDNVVILKEIVTSKGRFVASFLCLILPAEHLFRAQSSLFTDCAQFKPPKSLHDIITEPLCFSLSFRMNIVRHFLQFIFCCFSPFSLLLL